MLDGDFFIALVGDEFGLDLVRKRLAFLIFEVIRSPKDASRWPAVELLQADDGIFVRKRRGFDD